MLIERKKAMPFLLRVIGYPLYLSGIYCILNKIFKNKGIYILMYHRIGSREDVHYYDDISVKKEEFIKQVEYLKKKYCCVSMSEAVSIIENNVKLDKDYMVFTFDDGYLDNIQHGLDIFNQYKVKPIIYVTAGKVETGAPIWTEIVDLLIANSSKTSLDIDIKGKRISGNTADNKAICEFAGKVKAVLFEMPQKELYEYLDKLQQELGVQALNLKNELLTWNDVKIFLDSGGEIGSHTMNHINFDAESQEIISNELIDSRKLIEERLNNKTEHFSYPFGKQNKKREIYDIVRMHYRSAVTIEEGINKCGSDVYHLKRIKISNHHSLLDVRTKLLKVKILDFFKRTKSF